MSRKVLLPFALVCAFMFSAITAGANTGTETSTTPSTPCAPIDLNQGTDANPACLNVPHFKASFTNRIWKFKGSVNEVDGYRHLLNFNLESMPGLPQRFAAQDDAILDQDMIARFRRSTRIYDPEGHRADPGDLYSAGQVVVSGKLLAQSAWLKGEDGSPIPTVRARRITIVDYADTGDDSGQGEQAPPVTTPEPPASEPTPVSDDSGDEGYRKYPRWNKYPKYQEHPEEEQPQEDQAPPAPTPTTPTPVSQPATGQGPMICEHTSHSEVSEDGSISTWVEVKCHRK